MCVRGGHTSAHHDIMVTTVCVNVHVNVHVNVYVWAITATVMMLMMMCSFFSFTRYDFVCQQHNHLHHCDDDDDDVLHLFPSADDNLERVIFQPCP